MAQRDRMRNTFSHHESPSVYECFTCLMFSLVDKPSQLMNVSMFLVV